MLPQSSSSLRCPGLLGAPTLCRLRGAHHCGMYSLVCIVLYFLYSSVCIALYVFVFCIVFCIISMVQYLLIVCIVLYSVLYCMVWYDSMLRFVSMAGMVLYFVSFVWYVLHVKSFNVPPTSSWSLALRYPEEGSAWIIFETFTAVPLRRPSECHLALFGALHHNTVEKTFRRLPRGDLLHTTAEERFVVSPSSLWSPSSHRAAHFGAVRHAAPGIPSLCIAGGVLHHNAPEERFIVPPGSLWSPL